MAETKKAKISKRLISIILAVMILSATMMFTGINSYADGSNVIDLSGFSAKGTEKLDISLGTLDWSLTTIDGKTVTKSTYSDKTVLMVFYRATMSGGTGICSNSNNLIGELASSSWIANNDIQIVAVDFDENSKDDVKAYKNKYAPNCNDIVFVYGSGYSLLWSLVRMSTGANSVSLAYCAVIKDNTLCYGWGGCKTANTCRQAMSNVSSVTCPESSIDGQVKAVVEGGDYQLNDARSMLQMVNELRTGDGAWYWNSDNKTKTVLTDLNPLTYDYGLEQLAMRRAAELAISYSHTRPDGTGCFDLLYNGIQSYGENIAYGYKTTQSMFDGWAEEFDDYSGQGHRRNMLNSKFTAIGIACFSYGGRLYWVQEFGYSNSGIADPMNKTLATPKLSSVANIAAGVKITWEKVTGAEKYRVIYKTEGGSW
ncbi:MAG: hypothetical protein J1E05_08510, partial [Eubacterium sp.]|nr:hypothetical protein [Eubacterium sp.]